MELATVTATRSAAQTIEKELIQRFGPEVDDHVIADCVRCALEDLSGSVSPDALPEMAARLALHRLDTAVVVDGS